MAAMSVGVPSELAHYWFDHHYKIVETNLTKAVIDPGITRGSSIVIVGDVGRGKSAMVSALLKEGFVRTADKNSHLTVAKLMIPFCGRVTYIRYPEFSEMIRSTLKDGCEPCELRRYSELYSKQLVIIDDVLAGSETAWDLTKLEDLIDVRYSYNMPTWLTTNISDKDMKAITGFERAYSRLTDPSWCRWFQLTGPDRRRGKHGDN